ncbi:MAG: TerB family tellurite resistance protein [Pseudohongiellaceae bacterium]
MLSSISNFFENYLKPDTEAKPENIEKQVQLATAALMIELCKSDQSIDEVETQTLVSILQSRFDLSVAMLDELMILAEQEARDATSLFQFTSLFNEEFDYAQKVQLVRNLWEVAYADGKLDRYEEHLIRKVADLLYVSHGDFIQTKLAVKEALDGM